VDIISRYKLSLWGIGILVILNLVSLGLIWYQHYTRPAPPPPPPPRPESREKAEALFARELRLSEDQALRFHELRARHFLATESLRLEIYPLAKSMLDELFSPSPDMAKVQALSESIGRKQAEFERIVFDHFRDLKQLCRPDQQKKLQSLIYESLETAKLKPPPPPGPREPR
jgi:protein CpxP